MCGCICIGTWVHLCCGLYSVCLPTTQQTVWVFSSSSNYVWCLACVTTSFACELPYMAFHVALTQVYLTLLDFPFWINAVATLSCVGYESVNVGSRCVASLAYVVDLHTVVGLPCLSLSHVHAVICSGVVCVQLPAHGCCVTKIWFLPVKFCHVKWNYVP